VIDDTASDSFKAAPSVLGGSPGAYGLVNDSLCRAPDIPCSPADHADVILDVDDEPGTSRPDVWVVTHDGRGVGDVPEDCLSAEERLRANAFSSDQLRSRYVLFHALVRIILAKYLLADPAQIAIGCPDRSSKPVLLDEPSLQFSLSHSADIALLAVTSNGPIGVDVEICDERARASARDFLERLVPEGERCDPSPGDPTSGISPGCLALRCWTRREAYLKARGLGLGSPGVDLSRLQFVTSPRPDAHVDYAWAMLDLIVDGRHHGCLACNHSATEPRFLRLTPSGPQVLPSHAASKLGGARRAEFLPTPLSCTD